MNKRAEWRIPPSLRKVVRALHRDAGYVAVGLTFIYALSGIAVNHIADWDPNFTQVRETYPLPASLPAEVDPDNTVAVRSLGERIQRELRLPGKLEDVYAVSNTDLDLSLVGGTLHVNLAHHSADYDGQKPRFLVRAANYLHTNRGKKAWTWVADAYAGILLYLATSGLFLLPLSRGFRDRKIWLVFAGALVPVVYVTLSPLG